MSPFLSKDVLVMDKQLQTTLETIYNYFSGIILRFHEPIIPEISIPYTLYLISTISLHITIHAMPQIDQLSRLQQYPPPPLLHT